MGKPRANLNAQDYCMLPEASSSREPQNMPSPAGTILMAPVGNKAIAQVNNNIYVVTIPKRVKFPT